MKKVLIAAAAILIVLGGYAFLSDGPHPQAGWRLDENWSEAHPSTQIYKDDSTGEYMAVISSGRRYMPPGKSFVLRPLGDKKYSVDNGVFYAEYDKETGWTAILDRETGRWTNWTPHIYIDNRTELKIRGSPNLWTIDPLNPYYTYNVVDIDYGGKVTRRIRVIEDSFQEYYIVDSDPRGNVLIAPTYEVRDLPSRDYFIDANKTIVPRDGFSFNKERGEKFIQTMYFDNVSSLGWPVTTDDSYSQISSTNDGYNEAANTVWATVWNAATGTLTATGNNLYVGTPKSGSTFYIERAGVHFDTSSISVGATISSAYLSLYSTGGTGGNASAYYNISDGQPSYPRFPMTTADYLRTNYPDSTVGYLIRPGSVGTYFNITIRPSKFSTINTTGANAKTRYALQNSQDTENFGGDSTYLIFGTAELGSGQEPRLVVVYTASNPPVSAFSCTPLVVPRNGTVTCTDSSTYTTGWDWYSPAQYTGGPTLFSGNKTNQNPTIFPMQWGYGELCLIATGSGGTDTECKGNYIYVRQP